ncbi:MAG: ABC transporter permease [Deltaproteobacteria bacterium]
MKNIGIMVMKRLALGVVTLIVISVLIFVGIDLLPGDVATAVLGQQATPETVAAFRKELKLDLPAPVRYVNWIGSFFKGDMGKSLANGRPVSELIEWRFNNTIFLAATSAVISVPFAILLGILAALYRNSWFDKAISVSTLSAISFPDFFIAYILILFLAVKVQIFPSLAQIDMQMPFWRKIYSIILPSLTLTLLVAAHMMRQTVNVLSSDFIEMAYLKGLKRLRVIVLHALPNALSPVINVVAVDMAYLIVGVVVVEVVFVYPGLGQLLVDSVTKRDIPVVQASGLVFALVYVLLNLLADIMSIICNPKLRNPR